MAIIAAFLLMGVLPLASLRVCVWLFTAEQTRRWLLANGWEMLVPLTR